MSFVTCRWSVSLFISQFMNVFKNRKNLVSVHFLRIVRSSHRRCSVKKGDLKISKISQKVHVLEFLSNNFTDLQACNVIKKRLQQTFFSCSIHHKYSKSFKNIIFLYRFSPLCCDYCALFLTLDFILLFFIENTPIHIDIGVRLKLLQRAIRKPLKHLRWSFLGI